MPSYIQTIGFAGVGLAFFANLPQIVHVLKEHCSAGISFWAWSLWALAGILVGIKAVSNGDVVFITFQSLNVACSIIIASFGYKYRHGRCAIHMSWV